MNSSTARLTMKSISLDHKVHNLCQFFLHFTAMTLTKSWFYNTFLPRELTYLFQNWFFLFVEKAQAVEAEKIAKKRQKTESDTANPYRCGRCGKGFENMTGLINHMSLAHGLAISPVEKKIKNKNCSSATNQIKVHIKAFICNRCEEPFDIIEDLMQHETLVHSTKEIKNINWSIEDQTELENQAKNQLMIKRVKSFD